MRTESDTRGLPVNLRVRLEEFREGQSGLFVVMTGAGISAESGIPTFRGKDGIWTVGSRNYAPMEIATQATFQKHPEAVWSWYLCRLARHRDAVPNPGHLAVVQFEQLLKNRFLLITQNIDGLHFRAGSSTSRTYAIHGHLETVRCARACGHPNWVLPRHLSSVRSPDAELTAQEKESLACPGCGGWGRPHVLWFDECYDEQNFRFDSSLAAAEQASVLLVVGTSGATNLPMQVGRLAAFNGALIVNVDPEPNVFSELAEQTGGFYLRGTASTILPAICQAMRR